mgnify:CR=1 FL=1
MNPFDIIFILLLCPVMATLTGWLIINKEEK